jgi:hypothetical protein
MFWRRRARRAVNPVVHEREAALAQVKNGPDEWLRWWRATGERELRCIVMTAWDPVGAGDAAEGWDEYDDYVPGIAYRLRDASTFGEAGDRVAEYLNHIERDFMGGLTDARRRSNSYLAESLVAWHEWSFEKGGRPPSEWVDED